MCHSAITPNRDRGSAGDSRTCCFTQRCKQPQASGLSRNGCQRRVGVARGGVWCLHASCSRASICVSDENASLLVYINADEVEQVTMRRRATSEMDSVA